MSSDLIKYGFLNYGSMINAGALSPVKNHFLNYSVPLVKTGAAPSGWANNFNGVANANIAKINGIAIASIAKVNGV